MTSSISEAPWIAIAKRKRAQRDVLIPLEWHIPDHYLPKDPPKLEHGPQSVLSIPSSILAPSEVKITENYSVATLLEAIKSRKLSSTGVANAFCRRAAIAQQLTNCLTEPLFDQARERAKFLDRYQQEKGEVFGPLHGLPISVKDTFNVAGFDSSIGLASLCFKPAAANAPLIDLLLSLGCVIIAKTNIPQTLASLDSVNNVFGRTMNPANRMCTAGGSSGGEGVMVAMKGCMVGIGTDVGGSIRVPAMCNGVYGLKPSVGRFPYGGQANPSPEGMSSLGVQACAGPIARSMQDIDYICREVVPRSWMFAEDTVPATWGQQKLVGSGEKGEVVIGILRGDGNCELLPPIDNVITEVAMRLGLAKGIKVVELPTSKAWTRAQSVMSKLMGIEGGQRMGELIESTGEPLVPWMSTRFRRGKPKQLHEAAAIQAQRKAIQYEMRMAWSNVDAQGRRKRKLDAIICPLAPHPVPPIEGYNAVGYTSSFVMLDEPAGTLPVRDVKESDLELGKPQKGKAISSWDEKTRELWDESKMDRRVYLGTKLSIQVVTPRLEDEQLAKVMSLIDGVLKDQGNVKSKL